MGLPRNGKGVPRDPGEKSLEEASLVYFVFTLVRLSLPPGALFIKKSLMKTDSSIFPFLETNEKQSCGIAAW